MAQGKGADAGALPEAEAAVRAVFASAGLELPEG